MRLPVTAFLIVAVLLFGIWSVYEWDHTAEILPEASLVLPQQGTVNMHVPIYFVAADTLTAERHAIEITRDTYCEKILETMAWGAESGKAGSIFDFGIEVMYSECVNDVCYIHLKGASDENPLWSQSSRGLYVWAVVNTLTENPLISSVQLLNEDQPIHMQIFGYGLDKPLTRMESLIRVEPTTASDTVLTFIQNILLQKYDLAYSMLTQSSLEHYDYNEFVRFATWFMTTYKQYEPVISYTNRHSRWVDVGVRFSLRKEGSNSLINAFEKFTVYYEDTYFKIELIQNEYLPM